MKARIVIKGQIAGNNTLFNKLQKRATYHKELPYWNKVLYYNTKTDARKAISEAFKELETDEPDMVGKIGGINRGHEWIEYDASRGEIVTEYD